MLGPDLPTMHQGDELGYSTMYNNMMLMILSWAQGCSPQAALPSMNTEGDGRHVIMHTTYCLGTSPAAWTVWLHMTSKSFPARTGGFPDFADLHLYVAVSHVRQPESLLVGKPVPWTFHLHNLGGQVTGTP
eukprot:GHUV01053561.1.p1 GENE.GHUV01053561.1~~GHUV01053561.1.p1  ORF type:complete len:131 (-),score=15.56 GHUV01053561.1:60-452(-)